MAEITIDWNYDGKKDKYLVDYPIARAIKILLEKDMRKLKVNICDEFVSIFDDQEGE